MDPISWLVVNIAGLIVGALQLFVPFLIVTLILMFIFNFVQKKTGWKWIGSAALTLLVSFTIFFFLLNLWFILNGAGQTDVSQIPYDIRDNPLFDQSQSSTLALVLRAIIPSVLAGIVFTLLLLPFAFIGVSIFDLLKKRFKGFWVRFGLTVFLGCILFIFLLAIFPWIPVSLVYLVFFGF